MPYLLRRTLQAIPLLIAISIVVFAMLQMTPGGPLASGEGRANVSSEQVERLRGRYGLDDPLPVQYLTWAGKVLTGDWGVSYNQSRPVLDVIADRLPTTLLLVGLSFLVALVVALVVGIVAALRQHTWLDYSLTGFAFAGLAVPSFWLGLICLYVFAYSLDWLPTGGLEDLRFPKTGLAAVWDRALHLAMPVGVLGVIVGAGLARYVRGAMLDVLSQDYVRTARGSGLPERTVILRHALRNAAIPIVTVAIVAIPELFLGTVVTESIFAIPGMGRLFVESADLRDYPVLLGLVMVGAVLFVIANMLADVTYRRLDPRVRL